MCTSKKSVAAKLPAIPRKFASKPPVIPPVLHLFRRLIIRLIFACYPPVICTHCEALPRRHACDRRPMAVPAKQEIHRKHGTEPNVELCLHVTPPIDSVHTCPRWFRGRYRSSCEIFVAPEYSTRSIPWVCGTGLSRPDIFHDFGPVFASERAPLRKSRQRGARRAFAFCRPARVGLFHLRSPSRGNTQDGDGFRCAQSNECSIRKES